MLETTSHAFFELTNLTIPVYHNEIPPDAMIQSTTSIFDAIFPFMATYYGMDIPIDFNIVIINAHNISVNQEKKTLSALVDLHGSIFVHYDNGTIIEAGSAETTDVDINLELKIKNNLTIAAVLK